jgi:hypothetical protein
VKAHVFYKQQPKKIAHQVITRFPKIRLITQKSE